MRLTLVASLVVCGFVCTGCESLNKTVRWPGKNTALTEQLANDQQRREAAVQQVAQGPQPVIDPKAIQQTNFPPAAGTPADAGDATTALLLRAKQVEYAHQNQAAKALYEQVLQQQPQNAEAHHRLGVLADQEGRYPEAQQHYQQALQQQPQNPSLLSDIGYSLYSQDRLDEAEQYLGSALQLQPENQYARNNLAQVYVRRAQQTGSQNDYKLAQEQFTIALGPQGAEQQMQQLLPQGPATSERRSLLNPFKRGGQNKAQNKVASKLEAPDPKLEKGNAELMRLMEETRAKMIANGELPQTRPGAEVAQRTAPAISQGPVPFDQMNNVMSQIDQEASQRQAMALRNSYPAPNVTRGGNAGAQNDWSSTNEIQPASGANVVDPTGGTRPNRYMDGPNVNGPNDRFHSSMPNVAGQSGQQPNWENGDPSLSGQSGNGPANIGQAGYGNVMRGADATDAQGWEQGGSAMSQSWPDRGGSSPTQYDARGQVWDGQSLMNNPAAGNTANQAFAAGDPTYNAGNGRSFGAQRPNGAAGTGAGVRGRPGGNNPGWDDGRQTAAQLGLDAGMGEMFPGGPGDQNTNGWNQQGNQVYPAGGDPGMYGEPTSRRSQPQGGTGGVSQADFYSNQPGYYNGPVQAGGPAAANFGNQGGEVNAPWNQPGMSPRNSRPGAQSQYGNPAGQAQGRFAPPSRQYTQPAQDLGGPMMYNGR